jgi:hypothetical protein
MPGGPAGQDTQSVTSFSSFLPMLISLVVDRLDPVKTDLEYDEGESGYLGKYASDSSW